MIPLISNKKQAVTNILRVTRISGSYKHLNLCWERQLKYKKNGEWATFFVRIRTNTSQKRIYWLNGAFCTANVSFHVLHSSAMKSYLKAPWEKHTLCWCHTLFRSTEKKYLLKLFESPVKQCFSTISIQRLLDLFGKKKKKSQWWYLYFFPRCFSCTNK